MTPRELDSADPRFERLLDLLADRATTVLSDADEAELHQLLAEGAVHPDSIDLVASALAVGVVTSEGVEMMPASLRMSIESSASKDIASLRGASVALVNDVSRVSTRAALPEKPAPSSMTLKVWGGWLAAAACLTLAGILALYRQAPGTGSATDPQRVRQVVDAASGTVAREWGPWPAKPQAEGGIPFDAAAKIQGRVVWNQSLQKGYMVFKGLPKNAASARQYQLWILDKKQQHPIDGGVFDMTNEGEVVVPIDAKIAVQEPIGFGVTEEPSGGVVVSDQSHRVVVALLQP